MQKAPNADRDVQIAKEILASFFSAHRALHALAPDFNWSGNLLGEYGEFIAIRQYGLVRAPRGSDGFDARTADGKTVQVKTNRMANQIGFRGRADLMLVLHIGEDGQWEQVYYGDFEPVFRESRYSARDNKRMIAMSKLKSLQTAYGIKPI